jgi:hypothetical protein
MPRSGCDVADAWPASRALSQPNDGLRRLGAAALGFPGGLAMKNFKEMISNRIAVAQKWHGLEQTSAIPGFILNDPDMVAWMKTGAAQRLTFSSGA